MNFSLQIGNDAAPWPTLKAIALAADRGSWHTLWNFDHLVPPIAELIPHLDPNNDRARYEQGDCLEAWTLLAAWAGITERVRLGSLVNAIPFRNPALLAKMAATVDHVSNGRLELGLGAAWHTGEARAYGIQLGGAKEKLDRFEEALKIIKLLLDPNKTDAERTFKGEYHQLDAAPFAPQPLQKKLPILIGGGGEKRTLRLVAEYADSYNFFGNLIVTKEIYVHKNQVLDEHCRAIGRDPKEIKRSLCLFADIEIDDKVALQKRQFMSGGAGGSAENDLLIGSPQRIIDGVGAYSDVHIDEVIFCGVTPHPEALQRMDEQVLRALQPAAAR